GRHTLSDRTVGPQPPRKCPNPLDTTAPPLPTTSTSHVLLPPDHQTKIKSTEPAERHRLRRVTELLTQTGTPDALVMHTVTIVAAGLQAIEHTDDDDVQRIIIQDINTAVHALIDAAPRADPLDQVDNSSAPTSRRGSLTQNFQGAFGNRRQPTPSAASTPARNTQPPEESTEIWNTIAADDAKAAKERRTKNTRGNWRPRGALNTVRTTTTRPLQQPAQQQERSSTAAAPTTLAAVSDPWSAPDSEPWGLSQQADPAHSAGDAKPPKTRQTDPAHSAGDVTQTLADHPRTSSTIATNTQLQIPVSGSTIKSTNQPLILKTPTNQRTKQNTIYAYCTDSALPGDFVPDVVSVVKADASEPSITSSPALASTNCGTNCDGDLLKVPGVLMRSASQAVQMCSIQPSLPKTDRRVHPPILSVVTRTSVPPPLQAAHYYYRSTT
ncbi:hypothetical protein AAVH_43082, partial [Aphelenchoides avenae]